MKSIILIIAVVLTPLIVTLPVHADDLQVFGDRVIEVDEVIIGDVIAVTGNLVIKGKITGTVVAYIGDITVENTAEISGNVVAKRGTVTTIEGAQIAGRIAEGDFPTLRIGRQEPVLTTREWCDSESDSPRKNHTEWEFSDITDFEANYSKVDGFYLGFSYDNFPFDDYGMRFRNFGSGGYGFASHTWQGQIGFGIGVGHNNQLEFSIDAFSKTHTEDSWYISDNENSLAAFFLHEDFRDYYQREGYGATLTFNPLRSFSFSSRFQAEQHGALENNTSWALFGGDKEFLPNLPAEEGMLREFIFMAEVDNRDDNETPTQGWWINAAVEVTNPDLASDFDFRRAIVDVRRYQPFTRYVNFDTRMRVGNSDGTLPLQKRFYLGGISSLPAFGLKEFSGKEFALFNAELHLHDHKYGPWGIGDELSLIFFTDIGMASDTPLKDLDSNQWASDVGLALGLDSGQARVQVAKRTDTSKDAYVFMFRIMKTF